MWRIDEVNGERVLRYMTPDAAVTNGCVGCHNAFELRSDIQARRAENGMSSGKTFRLAELMGAIEAYVPLGRVETIASQNTKSSLNTVVLISFFGLFLVGGVSIASFNREKSEWDIVAGEFKVKTPRIECHLEELIPDSHLWLSD